MRSDYVKSWIEVEILPGALGALARLHAHGHRVSVVTNQACIGRGIVTAATVAEINRRLADEVEAAGGEISSYHVCPHRPDEGCDCRKPKPGLLLAAAARLGADPHDCFMIGDQISDIEAARTAGCRPIWVAEDGDCRSLAEAVDLIIGEAAAS